jgi:hypothetical protein
LSDLSEQAIEVARANAIRLGLQDRVEFRVGDLLEPVRSERATVVIGDVSGIPDEIGRLAGWFPDGHAGGPTGAELPAAMLESIRENDCLVSGGRIYLPTGTLQAEGRILDAARRLLAPEPAPPPGARVPPPDRRQVRLPGDDARRHPDSRGAAPVEPPHLAGREPSRRRSPPVVSRRSHPTTHCTRSRPPQVRAAAAVDGEDDRSICSPGLERLPRG